jgi:hypothetical protein
MFDAAQARRLTSTSGFDSIYRTRIHLQYEVVRPAGFEPTTLGFGGRYSIQLSYRRIIGRGGDTTRRRQAASSVA